MKKTDPGFCLEAAEFIHPDCNNDKCQSYDVTLLGTYYEEEEGGLFLFIKCNRCGNECESGDGDFWKYYKYEDGQLWHMSDEEIKEGVRGSYENQSSN